MHIHPKIGSLECLDSANRFWFPAKKCVLPLYPTESCKHSSNTSSTITWGGQSQNMPQQQKVQPANLNIFLHFCVYLFCVIRPWTKLHITVLLVKGEPESEEEMKKVPPLKLSQEKLVERRGRALKSAPRQKCHKYDFKKWENLQIFLLAPFNVDLAGGLVDGGRVPCHLTWVSNLSICTSPHTSWPFLFI